MPGRSCVPAPGTLCFSIFSLVVTSARLPSRRSLNSLRTGVSTSNTAAVLDGDIDQFTAAALAQKAFGTAPAEVEDVE